MNASTDDGSPLPDTPSLSLISTELLLAELASRQEQDSGDVSRPACGSSNSNGAYNTPAHVFALVLILVVSTLACSFPIIARRFPRLPIPHRFLFLSRHFGTGVLIATAFVHLLPTAFDSLTDACLPPFWTEGYRAMPGFIAMVSVLAVVGIEMFFAIRGAGHVHGGPEYDKLDSGHGKSEENGHPAHPRSKPPSLRPSVRRFRAESIGYEESRLFDGGESGNGRASYNPVGEKRENRPLDSRSNSRSRLNDEDEVEQDSDLDLDDFDPAMESSNSARAEILHNPFASTVNLNRTESSTSSTVADGRKSNWTEFPPLNQTQSHNHLSVNHEPGTDGDGRPITPSTQKAIDERKLILQCFLLEAGILFHSIFIGMALSVATGSSFVVLLVAISFHQTFEGLALGSRISAISSFGPTSPKPWLMALAYGATTPIGQAIGLAVHNLYDPARETGLLMVGFMNAISSGLLLFAGLVELLAEDFLSDTSYEVLTGSKRLQACASVVAGSMLMALVGAWA